VLAAIQGRGMRQRGVELNRLGGVTAGAGTLLDREVAQCLILDDQTFERNQGARDAA
jgi:hypothetical protein